MPVLLQWRTLASLEESLGHKLISQLDWFDDQLKEERSRVDPLSKKQKEKQNQKTTCRVAIT